MSLVSALAAIPWANSCYSGWQPQVQGLEQICPHRTHCDYGNVLLPCHPTW